MDFKTVPELVVGDKINYEYAPGREADAEVKSITDNEDGTYTLSLGRFGLVYGWTANDNVLVVN